MDVINDVTNAIGLALGVFVPIFVAMDPLGAVPLVIGWTGDLLPAERRLQFRYALLTALAVGLAFLVGGKWLLGVLGVGVPDFQIAGGLVLLVLAVNDILAAGGRETRGSPRSADFGVVPIGTPLLAGPATLTTLLVLLDRYGPLFTVLAFLVNLLIAWRLFQQAGDLTRLFGQNGLRATSKVISLLLAGIAIKFIREGVMLILGLPGP
ncbi:MAG: MarC family protein [Bacteroidetes bacterium]|nr:MarC family protein [Bacteroidota bacterium]